MVGGFVGSEIIWDFFRERFLDIYVIVILFEVEFVVLKGVVYLGYILSLKLS